MTSSEATVAPIAADSFRTTITPVRYAATVATRIRQSAAASTGSVWPSTVADPANTVQSMSHGREIGTRTTAEPIIAQVTRPSGSMSGTSLIRKYPAQQAAAI